IYGRKLSQIPSSTSLPPASEGDLSHYSLLTTHYSIDISHLPAGIYFVKISTATGEVVKKIVKK
ncbi:MAG: T9SS type A sorting domain-containing protein, partial [Bacteroidales bacterium]|nr:T9SS type A sorting domain-containing protein [Bacteroidales bacterium]